MKIKLGYIYANGFSYWKTEALDRLMNRINEELSHCNPVNIVSVQIFKEEDSVYEFEFSAVVTYTTCEN